MCVCILIYIHILNYLLNADEKTREYMSGYEKNTGE